MGHAKSRLGVLIFVFMLSACGQEPKGWASFPVKLVSDETFLEPAKKADLIQAIQFWESKAGRPLFDYQGVGQMGENRISIQNPWNHGGGVVGLTFLNYIGAEIVSGNIVINGAALMCEADCETRNGVTSRVLVIAHELGHFLGLNHTQDPADVMYPTTIEGSRIVTVNANLNALKEVIDLNLKK